MPPSVMMNGSMRVLEMMNPIMVSSATAEATPLPARSMDLVVVADALHFIDAQLAGEEIARQINGAKLVSLDAAHISNVEQPTKYTETVLGFLKG